MTKSSRTRQPYLLDCRDEDLVSLTQLSHHANEGLHSNWAELWRGVEHLIIINIKVSVL
jgi:hypothetical protein